MTNRERLEKMSDEELAEWLCSQHTDCNYCTKRYMCNEYKQNGFLTWLGLESNDDQN